MPARVYIETSIPSFYFDERTEPEVVVRRNWGREWWEERRHYELVTGLPVLEELQRANEPKRSQALGLVSDMPVLAFDGTVADIVEVYIARLVMPQDPGGDALHLALASYHRCDYLLTWNCQHLANANKFPHIRRVNTLLGLFVPMIVTPVQLLHGGGQDET